MKINESGQYIIDESDAIQSLLSGMKINEIVTEDTEWVNVFNINTKLFDIDYRIRSEKPTSNKNEYIEKCRNEWYMPDEYKNMDIKQFLLDKCKTETEIKRVNYEYQLYKEKDLITLIKFLCFFVDTVKDNDIILGVGRGSSVSSYILYLIGIHKVNSIKYDLDIKEFLK